MVDSTVAAKASLTPDIEFKVDDKGIAGVVPYQKEDTEQRAELLAAHTQTINVLTELLAATTALSTTLGTKLDAITAALGGSPVGPAAPIDAIAVTWDMDLVQNQFVGSTLADLTVVQPVAKTVPNYDGSLVNIGANEVARSDIGVHFTGVGVEYIGKNSVDPAAWTLTDLAWTNTVVTPSPGDADGVWANPVTLVSASGTEGYIEQGFTEAVAPGDLILIKVRFKHKDVNGSGAVRLIWGAGTDAEQERWFHNGALNQTGNPAVISDHGYTAAGTYSQVVHYERDAATGEVEFWITHEVLDANLKLRVFGNGNGSTVGVMGMQVTRGYGDQPWVAVANATVANGADDYQLGGAPLAAFQGAAGWIGIETDQISYETLGTGGVAGVAGDLLKAGAVKLLTPAGPTAFRVNDAVDGAVGPGGFRGIARTILAWDAGGWFAYVNGGKVASGIGAINRAGIAHLFNGLTGRARRLSGGVTLPSSGDAQTWSRITNRTFVRPGDALAADAVMVNTFLSDFDADEFQEIGAPAFPYPSSEALSAAYRPSWLANKNLKWRDRSFTHTANPYGSGQNAINNEPQDYLAKVAGNYPTHVIANGEYRQIAKRTATLSVDERARVPNDPHTGAQFAYVSATATTFGPNGDGGFNQRFGLWEARVKPPAAPGTWSAFWLYNFYDTSEMDIFEYYGTDPNNHTSFVHAWAEGQTQMFGYNDGGAVNMGFDLSQDFHNWALVWKEGVANVYLDGRLVRAHVTNVEFDKNAKFIQTNLALQPDGAVTGVTEAAMDAGTILNVWDRISVYQFAAE